MKNPPSEAELQRREDIAQRYNKALELFEACNNEHLDYLPVNDQSKIKYDETKDNCRKVIDNLTAKIEKITHEFVCENNVADFVRQNGFITNIVKGSLENIEQLTQEMNTVVKEVRTRCHKALAHMGPPIQVYMTDENS